MIPFPQILLRFLAILLMAGLIGLERHLAHRPAGIRTFILVGLGSCLVMILGLSFASSNLYVDPGRIAGQVLTGIGFIGAGVIFRSKGEIQGITTAATIFMVACIGLAAGAGYYILAATATVFALVALAVIGQIEHHGEHDA